MNRRTKFKIAYQLSILFLIPSIANAAVIDIPFLNDIWETMTKNVLPIVCGLGLIGAFIADRHDSETGKRVLLTVVGLVVAVKIVVAFIAWLRTAF